MVQVTEAQPGDHGAATLVAPYHEVDQSFWSEIRELKLRGNGTPACRQPAEHNLKGSSYPRHWPAVQCWARGNTQGSRGSSSSSVLSSLLSGSMTHPKGLGAGTTATETTTTHHALVSYFAVFAAISTLEAHLVWGGSLLFERSHLLSEAQVWFSPYLASADGRCHGVSSWTENLKNEISQKRKAKVGRLWSQLHVISGPILYGLRAPERPRIRWDEVASRNGKTAKHVEA
ncbi:hypothetical protein GE21DRAFT_7282 [Neurospora crassa]|uniref:Uncharacterized protein n=2 Tax=Neurospora crassa TaxID=5141 RepID=Q1K7Y3_NEUCR|nr:hypothetical protein NCU03721 [Neurospora crassa OR74A]EAA32261.1 hypothetical protein NCU03721 [Neurospora crassa OR74A]KHE88213.1 hypothetical protein GE21DRAFT_7282 [Neurospora crassa]CAC28845.2 hypothetical protein [Neurospora crassa]|eukprot:XP_961497.1 hypothetical protein NCU03721 [Neurospora crassa OR74A]